MRLENRKNDETREIKFTRNYTKHALGSVLAEFGDTKVITTASVEIGKPKWMSKEGFKRLVNCRIFFCFLLQLQQDARERRSKISGRTPGNSTFDWQKFKSLC